MPKMINKKNHKNKINKQNKINDKIYLERTFFRLQYSSLLTKISVNHVLPTGQSVYSTAFYPVKKAMLAAGQGQSGKQCFPHVKVSKESHALPRVKVRNAIGGCPVIVHTDREPPLRHQPVDATPVKNTLLDHPFPPNTSATVMYPVSVWPRTCSAARCCSCRSTHSRTSYTRRASLPSSFKETSRAKQLLQLFGLLKFCIT